VSDAALLEVRELSAGYGPGPERGGAPVIERVGLVLQRGSSLALVGESGSGKSTLARALARALPPGAWVRGSAAWRGGGGPLELVGSTAADWRRIAPRIGLVLQDSGQSLDPRRTVGESIGEALEFHRLAAGAELGRRIGALLESVGLAPVDAARPPHAFSGGERQRVALARALATDPELLICDEPTSGLDARIQAALVELLERLARERGLALLFVSHDLALVRRLAARTAVVYAGRVVEVGPTAELLESPLHPYARALVDAALALERGDLAGGVLAGEAPPASARPAGCAFHPRCALAASRVGALERCAAEDPELVAVARAGASRRAACHYAEGRAATESATP
jgi:peptide/nickel transport system ATP-binding protein